MPFLVWGGDVPAGRDLYSLNPGRRDPGSTRPEYSGAQPIRNGDVANVVTAVLGLEAVPGSEFNRDQSLRVQIP